MVPQPEVVTTMASSSFSRMAAVQASIFRRA
jgi:hypothetical protein